MAKAIIGRVRPQYVGEWDSTRSYVNLDRVGYDGIIWEAYKDVPPLQDAPYEGSPYWCAISVQDVSQASLTTLRRDLDKKAWDDEVVHLDGSEVIRGDKEFKGELLAPIQPTSDNSNRAATTAFVQTILSEFKTENVDYSAFVSKASNQTITGLKTFTQNPLVPSIKIDDVSQKAANTAFVHLMMDNLMTKLGIVEDENGDIINTGIIGTTDANAVHKTGDETVDGKKTFLIAPDVPDSKYDEGETQKAVNARYVQGFKWLKSLSGSKPEDVTDIVANMPVDGLVLFPDDSRSYRVTSTADGKTLTEVNIFTSNGGNSGGTVEQDNKSFLATKLYALLAHSSQQLVTAERMRITQFEGSGGSGNNINIKYETITE